MDTDSNEESMSDNLTMWRMYAEEGEGILTSQSYNRKADGTKKDYSNVDWIVINSGYALFKDYVSFLLFDLFSPEFPVNPFFLLSFFKDKQHHIISFRQTNVDELI